MDHLRARAVELLEAARAGSGAVYQLADVLRDEVLDAARFAHGDLVRAALDLRDVEGPVIARAIDLADRVLDLVAGDGARAEVGP